MLFNLFGVHHLEVVCGGTKDLTGLCIIHFIPRLNKFTNMPLEKLFIKNILFNPHFTHLIIYIKNYNSYNIAT